MTMYQLLMGTYRPRPADPATAHERFVARQLRWWPANYLADTPEAMARELTIERVRNRLIAQRGRCK